MGQRVARVKHKGALKLAFGARPVPVVIRLDRPQRGVALGQGLINLQALHRRRFRFRHHLSRRERVDQVVRE